MDWNFTFKVQNEKPVPGHFWEAVGCDSMFPQMVNETGAFLFDRSDRFGCLKYIRNHHVLSSLKHGDKEMGGNVYSEDENGNPIYDFTFINSVYAQCVAHGIKPVVEMDFVPEALARPRTTPLVPGGDMYEQQVDFRRMVETRDPASASQSAEKLPCPVIKLNGTAPVEENIAAILAHLK